MSENSIVLLDPAQSIAKAKQMHQILLELRSEVLVAGTDYDVIPGTTKPTLLKPGAEKLCWALGLSPEFEDLDKIQDFDKPLFHYRYRCVLRHIETGKVVATGIGSCNSMESKYGFRWLPEHQIPPHLNKSDLLTRIDSVEEFEFAINQGKTSGQWGKPAEYWQAFKDAIANGTAEKFQKQTKRGMSDAWRITTITYRVPNEDVFSIVNTIDKMAQKRALIAATLIGANASEFFTQDIEDMPDFSKALDEDVIEGEVVEDAPQPQVVDKPKEDSDYYKKQERRKKVIAAFDGTMKPTEVISKADELGADWDSMKSDDIIQLVQSSLAATGTENEIPF